MSKNPVINALCALGYIIFVVAAMTLATRPLQNKPDTFFAPIVALSVLTLSVAVMAYMFFTNHFSYLLMEKEKKQ